MALLESILAQHAEEAAFLWHRRTAACRAPHYRLKDLTYVDQRVEAHLDGLRIAGEEAWEACEEIWTLEDAGEVFAAGVLAWEEGDADRIETVVAAATAGPLAARGAASALGWLAPHEAGKHLWPLLKDEDPNRRWLGLAAAAAHRIDPGAELHAALQSDDPRLAARACRAAGELGRTDLLPHLQTYFLADDEALRFWSCWSGTLLGDRTAVTVLRAFAPSPAYGDRAVELAIRRMPEALAQGWLADLASEPALVRAAISGLGAFGDPAAIALLVELMDVPELARVAGEAFCLITGVDLVASGLGGAKPGDFEAGPTDDPQDENVAMDPDENLPWPSGGKTEAWWAANRGAFPSGVRHLLGSPITEESLRAALRAGYQRQRAHAALELALLRTGKPLFESRAPGVRQRQELAA